MNPFVLIAIIVVAVILIALLVAYLVAKSGSDKKDANNGADGHNHAEGADNCPACQASGSPVKVTPPEKQVTKAYFAKKVETEIDRVNPQPYTVTKRDNYKRIASAHTGVDRHELERAFPRLHAGQNITLQVHSKVKQVSFEKITMATIGTKACIVVETTGMKDTDFTIEILGSNNTTFIAPDQAVTLLSDGEEKNSFDAKLGAFTSHTEFENAATFNQKVIVELELKPKDDSSNTKRKDWSKKILATTERKAFLHLKVKAKTESPVGYMSEDDKIVPPALDKGIFLNKSGLWFELYACFCNKKMTEDEMKAVFTKAAGSRLTDMTTAFNEAFENFFVETCLRKAHFFAQVLQEVGSTGEPKSESLNYDAARLKRRTEDPGPPIQRKGPFSVFWDNPEADTFGRNASHPANQEAIANRAYGGQNGNGDFASGDGFKFRGRGYIQLTFKSNYVAAQAEITARFPGSNLNIVTDVNSLETIRGAMISAMAFWSQHSIQTRASVGETDAVVNSVTSLINPGTDSRGDRINNFHSTKKVFKTSECATRTP